MYSGVGMGETRNTWNYGPFFILFFFLVIVLMFSKLQYPCLGAIQ